MNISSIGAIQNTFATTGVTKTAPQNAIQPASLAKTDDVKFSAAARQMENIGGSQELGGVRLDLVNRVRAEIANGTYDTEEKMNIAVDRMVNRFNPR
ncbi:MAG: flagellar biosynthesis anti-sigma factor FlgM [Planctomycetaceae bacterium]|jgi:negative regulator of flagellin synthesis FlgM|nr:flagellar biosynthesis anti-sigma factor FlgM [Planctomycetaceae bacterium]